MSEDKGYIVRDVISDVPSVPCPCGQSIRAITGADTDLASIHLVTISKDSRLHYHKKLTEFYYVLEGEGELQLPDVEIAEFSVAREIVRQPRCEFQVRRVFAHDEAVILHGRLE